MPERDVTGIRLPTRLERTQDTARSCGYRRSETVCDAREGQQKKLRFIPAEDAMIRPVAFSRNYWLRRRGALKYRLLQLYYETGDPQITRDVVEYLKCSVKVRAEPMRQDPQRSRPLTDRLMVLWTSFCERGFKGDLPTGKARRYAPVLMEHIRRCDQILMIEDNYFDTNNNHRPENELNLTALAAFASFIEQGIAALPEATSASWTEWMEESEGDADKAELR